jgi:hypothetical protein
MIRAETTTERLRRLAALTLAGLFTMIFGLGGVAAWSTHIYVCFNNGQWGFLVAGALFFPVAVIHGIGIWFGWWPGIQG